jgi:hypothetical protein
MLLRCSPAGYAVNASTSYGAAVLAPMRSTYDRKRILFSKRPHTNLGAIAIARSALVCQKVRGDRLYRSVVCAIKRTPRVTAAPSGVSLLNEWTAPHFVRRSGARYASPFFDASDGRETCSRHFYR